MLVGGKTGLALSFRTGEKQGDFCSMKEFWEDLSQNK